MKGLKKRIPNLNHRAKYLDLYMERVALREDHHRAHDAKRAAYVCGDLEREEFYDSLRKSLNVELDFIIIELNFNIRCFVFRRLPLLKMQHNQQNHQLAITSRALTTALLHHHQHYPPLYSQTNS